MRCGHWRPMKEQNSDTVLIKTWRISTVSVFREASNDYYFLFSSTRRPKHFMYRKFWFNFLGLQNIFLSWPNVNLISFYYQPNVLFSFRINKIPFIKFLCRAVSHGYFMLLLIITGNLHTFFLHISSNFHCEWGHSIIQNLDFFSLFPHWQYTGEGIPGPHLVWVVHPRFVYHILPLVWPPKVIWPLTR